MTLQRDVLHGGISRLWQTSIMVYKDNKDFALIYGYEVFFIINIEWFPVIIYLQICEIDVYKL